MKDDDGGVFDERDWIIYSSKKGLANRTTPMVSIQAGGKIGLNRYAVEKLGNPELVVFLFNPKLRMIGIRPAKPEEDDVHRLIKQTSSSNHTVSAKSFLQDIQYPSLGTLRSFTPKYQNGILMFPVDQSGEGNNNGYKE